MNKVLIPQPSDIEKYLIDKGNKGRYDHNAKARKFRISAEEMLTMLSGLDAQIRDIKAKKHYKAMSDKFKDKHFANISDGLVIRYLVRDGIKRTSITKKMIASRRAQILEYRSRRKNLNYRK